MKIDLFVRYSTNYGEAIAVTGNLISLGNFSEEDALPMDFLNREFWHTTLDIDPVEHPQLEYHYIFINHDGKKLHEGERSRIVNLSKKDTNHLVIIDAWNDASSIENVFYTAPFKEVFLAHKETAKHKKHSSYTHEFKVKAPLLAKDEVVCLLGNADALHNWEKSQPVFLQKKDDWWTVRLDLSSAELPVLYKYGIYNTEQGRFVRYEEGDNRTLHHIEQGELFLLHDGFVRIPNLAWRGAGIAIPVFSLRSENSFGIGEFNDIKLLADWASETGLKLIQLLPINDTSATFTAADSYPYAAISAFALHPVYINLPKVAGKKNTAFIRAIQKKQKQLNNLADVDYETVIRFKMQYLKELYEEDGGSFLKQDDFKEFFERNTYWLQPYAVFCYLRDKYKTAAFSQWRSHSTYNAEEIEKLIQSKGKAEKEIRFYYFIQYHLHLQLTEAVNHAHKKSIALKGDIPIGIFRNSVDAWRDPELYHMDWQAGAPPDDFAVKGQNWGFPTYNWQKMQETGFEWWRKRFEQMSHYFDAFRIDHILGFFRIWSIPMDAVEGIMGRFIPALPVHVYEFGEKGIWFDHDRYLKPYITDAVLQEIFGHHATFVKESFLQPNDREGYDLLPEFNSQKKVQEYFAGQDSTDDNELLRAGLFDLVSNVLLFEEEGSNGTAFHFRISMKDTSSYNHLDDNTKKNLYDLYIDYFYHRQDEFWKEEASKKLPYLKAATNMLVCGEDLGMVPRSVPEVMRELAILSLEIQRMPKDPKVEFFHPQTAPYLSVVTPSTHDMSTIRGWWEEDRERTQKFYNTVLGTEGTAPYFCDSWINRAIVLQHLYSPAMWSIFQLQDLLGMNDDLRRKNPAEERINQPADPNHYWRYRMHISLEKLMKEKEFNKELADYISNSGRA